MQRYRSLSGYLAERFDDLRSDRAVRIRKIPLDASRYTLRGHDPLAPATTCPNRAVDGSGGCVFCNPRGSGTGKAHLPLAEQWAQGVAAASRARRPPDGYLAYLQAYSATYGPLERLDALLADLAQLPDCLAISLGTRPDCLSEAKLDLIAALPFDEIWLELGLQSAKDATLDRMNRGHDAATFARAAETAHERGLKVVAHVIHGLPGETTADFLATIDFVNGLPVHGVKLHTLYVAEGSQLAEDYRAGRFSPASRAESVAAIATAIARLRPEIVLHRLTGDPAPGECLAPAWATDKNTTLAAIQTELAAQEIVQGCRYSSS